jgi:hypothetical protein
MVDEGDSDYAEYAQPQYFQDEGQDESLNYSESQHKIRVTQKEFPQKPVARPGSAKEQVRPNSRPGASQELKGKSKDQNARKQLTAQEVQRRKEATKWVGDFTDVVK